MTYSAVLRSKSHRWMTWWSLLKKPHHSSEGLIFGQIRNYFMREGSPTPPPHSLERTTTVGPECDKMPLSWSSPIFSYVWSIIISMLQYPLSWRGLGVSGARLQLESFCGPTWGVWRSNWPIISFCSLWCFALTTFGIYMFLWSATFCIVCLKYASTELLLHLITTNCSAFVVQVSPELEEMGDPCRRTSGLLCCLTSV